ncbi:MAG: hypothetical protein ABI612_12900 [Betaproteobacteria bacterium]
MATDQRISISPALLEHGGERDLRQILSGDCRKRADESCAEIRVAKSVQPAVMGNQTDEGLDVHDHLRPAKYHQTEASAQERLD